MGNSSKTGSPAQSGEVGIVSLLSEAPSNVEFARLFHRHRRPGHSVRDTMHLLNSALSMPRSTPTVKLLLTGAGRTCIEAAPMAYKLASEEEVKEIEQQALLAAAAVRRELQLGPRSPWILLGIDVLAASTRADQRQVGQFAAVLRPDRDEITLLAKSFPTVDEVSYLRVTEGAEHVLKTPYGDAAVFVCHDINVYSSRGEAMTTDGKRRGWRDEFKNEVDSIKPQIALFMAHGMWKVGSFRQAYAEFTREVGIPLIGARSALSFLTTPGTPIPQPIPYQHL